MNRIYIKIGILSLLLLLTSYFLTNTILIPIKTHNYFGVSLEYSLKIIALMLVEVYLFSLSVGIWGNWKQYLFVALPPMLGITLVTIQINIFYGTITSAILFALLCVDIARSNDLKNTLIIFKPIYVLSLSTSGLLFIFSIIGGVMVILSSPDLPKINVGKSLATVIEPQVKKMVSNELQKQTQNEMSLFNVGVVDPAIKEILDQAQTQTPVLAQNYVDNINFSSLIENQINNFVTPYKDFLHPILAVLMFLLFQFYASITRVIFAISIEPLFKLAKKLKFLHIEKVTVEKEVLKF